MINNMFKGKKAYERKAITLAFMKMTDMYNNTVAYIVMATFYHLQLA